MYNNNSIIAGKRKHTANIIIIISLVLTLYVVKKQAMVALKFLKKQISELVFVSQGDHQNNFIKRSTRQETFYSCYWAQCLRQSSIKFCIVSVC